MSDDKRMGWDDEIDPSKANEFSLLPEGEAFFTVTKLKREVKDMGKLGSCNVATLSLKVEMTEGDQSGSLQVNLPLHEDMWWKLLLFFTAIGQREHGDTEPFRPDWKKVEGETGACYVNVREFKKKDGSTGQANDIKRWGVAEHEAKEAKTPEKKKRSF